MQTLKATNATVSPDFAFFHPFVAQRMRRGGSPGRTSTTSVFFPSIMHSVIQTMSHGLSGIVRERGGGSVNCAHMRVKVYYGAASSPQRRLLEE
jgi:hypothetical protein